MAGPVGLSDFEPPSDVEVVDVDPGDDVSLTAAQAALDAAGAGPWAVIAISASWSTKLARGPLSPAGLALGVGRLVWLVRPVGAAGPVAAVWCRVAVSPGRVWAWPAEAVPGAHGVVAATVDEALLEPLGWCEGMAGTAVLGMVDARPGVVAAAISALGLDTDRAAAVRRAVGPGAQGSQLCSLVAALAGWEDAPSARWCAAARAVSAASGRGWPLPDVGFYDALVARASLVADVAACTGAPLELVAELGADGLGAADLAALVRLAAGR